MSLDPTFPQKRLRVSISFEAQVDSNHPRRCSGPGTSLPVEIASSAWQLKLFAPFFLVLLALFSGCGARNSAITASTSQPSSESATFAASPASLSFGNVTAGTTHSLSDSIKNTGTRSVTISAVTVSGTGYHISGLSLPLTLQGGQSTKFSVSFAPSASGTSNGSLRVTTSVGSATVPLTGTGVAASTHSVDLAWAASATSNVGGYNVYRSAYSGSCGKFAKLNSSPTGTTVYTDRTVANGASYCYAVTAINTAGTESSYSNIVSDLKIPSS